MRPNQPAALMALRAATWSATEERARLNDAVRATETKTQGLNTPAELEGNDSATMIAETAKQGNDQQQVHINSWLELHPSTSFFFQPCCKLSFVDIEHELVFLTQQ